MKQAFNRSAMRDTQHIRERVLGGLAWLLLLAIPQVAFADCPFCDAVRPTWSQLREPADAVVLAKVVNKGTNGTKLRVETVARGEHVPDSLELSLSSDLSPGETVLLLGEQASDDGEFAYRWTDIAMSDAAFKYLDAAPDLRALPTDRLRYFAAHLEHAEQDVAEDAYMEFAHASYSDVAAMGDAFDGAQLRAWLTDPNVPDLRKGFYALALALAGGDQEQQQANIDFLRDWVNHPGDDFRRGLDGVMGALLLAEKNDALQLIREKFLANPDAANGHVRNALAAIRFYHEFGEAPDTQAIASAVACLLDRPAFATEAVIDLARWEAWEALPQVVALFEKPDYDNTTKHAVVAYLLTCDEDVAIDELERLRELDADFVNSAEERFLLFGGIR